jgi:MFS family permease
LTQPPEPVDAPTTTPRADSGWLLLRQPYFAAYWASGLVSNMGTWLHNVTAGVVMLRLTDSAFMVGLVSVATFLPMLLFSLAGGALADRNDRRVIVGITQGVALATGLSLAGLVATDHLHPVQLLAGCFVIGTCYSIAKPALSAMLPDLVPRSAIVNATAFNTLQFNLGQVLGPGLATLVLLVGSPAVAFGLNSLTFLVQVLVVLRLPDRVAGRRRGDPTPAARRGGVLGGLAFIRETPPMGSALVAVVLANAAVEALRTLAPLVARDVLHQEPAVAGTIVLGSSAGAVVGVLAFPVIRRYVPPVLATPLAFALQATGVLVIALAPASLALVMLAAFPVGLSFSYLVGSLSGRLQELATDDVRGRVMSAFSMSHLGCRPAYAVLVGSTTSLLGVRWAFLAVGLLAAVGAGLSWRRRLGSA